MCDNPKAVDFFNELYAKIWKVKNVKFIENVLSESHQVVMCFGEELVPEEIVERCEVVLKVYRELLVVTKDSTHTKEARDLLQKSVVELEQKLAVTSGAA